MANFLTTHVRYYFSPILAPPAHASRGLASSLAALPMPLLGCATSLRTLGIVAPIDTVHVAPVAAATEKEHPPALIGNALNLTEIIHCMEQPPGIGPTTRTRATTRVSNASTAAIQGSELMASGPTLWWRSPRLSLPLYRWANYPIKPGCSDSRAFARSRTRTALAHQPSNKSFAR